MLVQCRYTGTGISIFIFLVWIPLQQKVLNKLIRKRFLFSRKESNDLRKTISLNPFTEYFINRLHTRGAGCGARARRGAGGGREMDSKVPTCTGHSLISNWPSSKQLTSTILSCVFSSDDDLRRKWILKTLLNVCIFSTVYSVTALQYRGPELTFFFKQRLCSNLIVSYQSEVVLAYWGRLIHFQSSFLIS